MHISLLQIKNCSQEVEQFVFGNKKLLMLVFTQMKRNKNRKHDVKCDVQIFIRTEVVARK